MNPNMMLNRPSYLDYGNNDTKKQEPTKTQAKPYEQNQPSAQRTNPNSNTNLNNNQSEPSTIFKKAKRNSSDYKINPDVIPRPKHFEEIYRSPSKSNVFDTIEDSLPPFSTSFYTVNEVQNSSPRFIRGTMIKIPTDQDQLNKANLILGIYCQPFAELSQGEKLIPQVQVNDDILRCTRCNCYVNNKFDFKFNKQVKRIAVCNCCNYELELNTNNSVVKSDYFSSDLSNVVELANPTVDFIAPQKFVSKMAFNPVYAIFIDISQQSIEIGFASYVLNSILSTLDFFDNKSNSSIFIATYDHSSIQFYLLDNLGEIKILVVSDIDSPFCPVPKEKLMLNVERDKNQLEKIIEKIQSFLTNSQTTDKKALGAATGAAIHAGYNALSSGGSGGRVIVLTCSQCMTGIGNSKARDNFSVMNTENEKTLYIPQNETFIRLGQESIEKEKIVFDLFVIHNQNLDFVNMSQICNQTGGNPFYYLIENSNDLKFKFEKLHYDLTRIFTRPNYNNVAFKLRANSEIDIVEVLGPFGKRAGSALSLAGCDPDFSLGFICRIKENIKPNSKVNFQLAVIFTDNYNKRFLRMLNYTILSTTDTLAMYKSIDVEVLTKLTMQKEINQMLLTGYNAVRTELSKKTISSLHYYREQTQKGQPSGQLILPESLKYFPLFLSSIYKKPIFRQNKVGVTLNSIINIINRISRDPSYLVVKYLYPRFYRVDDILEERPEVIDRLRIDKENIIKNIGDYNEETNIIQKPYLHGLTMDRVCLEGAYLLDDGIFIYFCIFNETSQSFLHQMFGVSSFDELASSNIDSLDESNNNDINIRIINIVNQIRTDNKGIHQPLKFLFINANSIPDEFLFNMIEDGYKGEVPYIDFLCDIHNSIQSKQNK